jgi:hypothetical protein
MLKQERHRVHGREPDIRLAASSASRSSRSCARRRRHRKVARSRPRAGRDVTCRRLSIAEQFMERLGLGPRRHQAGSRAAGTGVATCVRARARVAAEDIAGDAIVQEYVPGLEFGVFYYGIRPKSRHIFSITEKRFQPSPVTAVRRSTIDPRRRPRRASTLHRQCIGRLTHVPTRGNDPLVEIGSHCRGLLFLDGRPLITPAVERAFGTVAQNSGFYFGRFDAMGGVGRRLPRRGSGSASSS